MEVILGVLFIYGCLYAMREGGRSAMRAGRRAGGGRATAPGTLAWWAGEAGRGFPRFRHGFAHGWSDHTRAVTEREHARTGAQADNAERVLTLRQEIAAHRARITRATAPPAAPAPGDPPLPSGHPGAGPAGGGPAQEPPPPAAPPNLGEQLRVLIGEQRNGHQPADDPPAPAGADSPAPAGQENGDKMPTNTSSGDLSYEQLLETAKKAAAAAENAVSSREVTDCIGLADQLAGMIPDDGDTLGIATDLSAAAQEAGKANVKLHEHATALQARVEKTYGETQEAVDASGVDAPDPAFLAH